MRCNSWDCPECRRIKALKYRDRMKSLSRFDSVYMLTLTYYHSRPPLEVWQEIGATWNRFRTAVSKKYGKFSYIRVVEPHNNSPYPHLHVIMTVKVPDAELGMMATNAGFGYQINQQKIHGKGALDYVSKYLRKTWTGPQTQALRRETRTRIVSFSRDLVCSLPAAGEWDCITAALGLDTCIDCIRNSIEWRGDATPDVTFESKGEYAYELTLIWREKFRPMLNDPSDDYRGPKYHDSPT